MDTTLATSASHDLLICFLDLSSYTLDARRTADDGRLADIVDGYYERVSERTKAAGGEVIKYIGDGALLIFPTTSADDAVESLLSLKTLGSRPWDGSPVWW